MQVGLRRPRRAGGVRSASRWGGTLLGLLGAGALSPGSLAAGEAASLAMGRIPARGQHWIAPAELAALPTSGPAWESLWQTAQEPTPAPDLSDMTDPTNVRVLAKALVYARTREPRYREEVARACVA